MAFDRSWRRIAYIILGIGAVIVAGGLAFGYGSLRLVLYGEREPGEVIEIVREKDMYSPVVRFRLPNGEMHEVKDLGVGAPDFAVGDQVTVLYWPHDPDDFRLATFERLWFATIFMCGFGSFWLLFGLVAWGLSQGVDLAVLGEGAFAVIALGGAVLGIVALSNAMSLYEGGRRTEGEVTEIRESRSIVEETYLVDGEERRRKVERISQAPIIRFTTDQGREIEFFGRGGTGGSYGVGDRVSVLYDSANPIRAHIVSFMDLWLPSAVAWGVALIFGGVVWLSRRTRRA
jgi:hypothetical protein